MKRTVRENRPFCFLNYIPPLVRAVEFLLTITHNGRISCASGVGMPYGFKSRLPTNAVQLGSLIEVVVSERKVRFLFLYCWQANNLAARKDEQL